MAKIKVHEYAKQIGKPAKELVSLLNENGINVKSHLSNVEDDGIAFLNKHFKANITGAPEKTSEKATKAKETTESKEDKPVNARVAASRGSMGRPTSARSVGTAASVKKEFEKAEKAKEREEARKAKEKEEAK